MTQKRNKSFGQRLGWKSPIDKNKNIRDSKLPQQGKIVSEKHFKILTRLTFIIWISSLVTVQFFFKLVKIERLKLSINSTLLSKSRILQFFFSILDQMPNLKFKSWKSATVELRVLTHITN